MDAVMKEQFVVSIYNAQRWGFSSYKNLDEEFQKRYHFRAYVQLISNIRKSIQNYTNNKDEMRWQSKYALFIKLQILFLCVAVCLAICGFTLLPMLYRKHLIGWTFIVFGLTFCGIGLCICGCFWYHNKAIGLLKRYQHLIRLHLDDGLRRLNTLYAHKAIFQVLRIVSTRSWCKPNIDLHVAFQISLLTEHVHRQSAVLAGKQRMKLPAQHQHKLPGKLSVSTSTTSIRTSNHLENADVDACFRMDSVGTNATETDQVVLLQMYNGQATLSQIVDTLQSKGHKNQYSKLSKKPQSNDEGGISFVELHDDSRRSTDCSQEPEVYSPRTLERILENETAEHEKEEQLRMNEEQLLQRFHSIQVYQDMIRLIQKHNNDEKDAQYNYYNIGMKIAKYFDNMFRDESVVVVVSDARKQPELSYISQSGYELKIPNVEGKDVFVYRAMEHIAVNVKNRKYVTNDFRQMVLNMSQIYDNTSDMASELDRIYGAGCQVARAVHRSYNIYCRFSDEMIARVDLQDNVFIIAWRT